MRHMYKRKKQKNIHTYQQKKTKTWLKNRKTDKPQRTKKQQHSKPKTEYKELGSLSALHKLLY